MDFVQKFDMMKSLLSSQICTRVDKQWSESY